jgi:hypothetical protein
MRIAPTRRLGLIVLATAVSCGLTAPGAGAQTPEFIPLGQGSFPSLASTWQANALAPSALGPSSVLLDLYDSKAILYQTYMVSFPTAPPKRTVTATGQRPLGLPTAAALVSGTAGKKVKTVKIFFAGAPTQKLATVKPPPAWGFGGRFFAAGTNVADTSAATTRVVTLIKALDGRGRLLSKFTNVFTNPF